jgi:YkoY family integral membrane protein
MFGQTFDIHDVAVVGLLVVLEGVLSIDNALVLGLLAKRLPKHQQGKALTYGLVGAFVFRFIAIAAVAWLLHWWFVKLLGGAYLIYVAVKHFLFERHEQVPEKVAVAPDGTPVLVHTGTGAELGPEAAETELAGRLPIPVPALAKFWPTVFVIEMTDIAFAVDSILAAVGVVGPAPNPEQTHPKLWVVIIGGFLGVILMRFAAVIFIKLLDRFPRFETAAYLLVIVIGLKLVLDWGFNKRPGNWPIDQAYHGPLDFHTPNNPAFWIFWGLMVVCFCVGFIPKREQPNAVADQSR